MPDLVARARKFILEKGMPPPGERILLGVSGGVDSMVMWHLLRELGYECSVLHIDYQLRGEASVGDARLVKETADQWGMKCRIVQIEPADWEKHSGLSMQMAAREIRYSLFEAEMKASETEWCALAHHQDDVAESLLLSILRGGKGGELLGIPPIRKPYFRPIWFATKEEIREYAVANQIPWREDVTNSESNYLRNVVRNQVLPAMEPIHPQPAQRWVEWGGEVQKQQALFQRMVMEWVQPHLHREGWVTKLDWKDLKRQFGGDFPVLLKSALQSLGFTGNHAHEIAGLAESPKGKIWKGDGEIVARTEDGIEWALESHMPDPEETLVIPGSDSLARQTFHFGGFRVKFHIQAKEEMVLDALGRNEFLLDLQRIIFPVKLRHWKEGDRMQPLGLGGTKKLKEIFADAKSSYFDKMRSIVFEDARQIICLSGYRINEAVAIQPETGQIIRIIIEED